MWQRGERERERGGGGGGEKINIQSTRRVGRERGRERERRGGGEKKLTSNQREEWGESVAEGRAGERERLLDSE